MNPHGSVKWDFKRCIRLQLLKAQSWKEKTMIYKAATLCWITQEINAFNENEGWEEEEINNLIAVKLLLSQQKSLIFSLILPTEIIYLTHESPLKARF